MDDVHRLMEDAHIAWCRALFDSLAENGVWGVPRSGLMFEKQADTLVLTEQMPHERGLPMSQEELLAYQDEDYDDIKRHFEAAGIPVRKA